MSTMKLYNYFRSSPSYRVRIALHYLEIPFEYVPVHLLQDGGQQYKDTYVQINPMKEVPSLVVQDKIISQSMAIFRYLHEIHKERSLFPQDAYLQAKVIQLCENINAGMHPLQNLKVGKYLQEKFHITEDQKLEWNQYWIQQGLEACEKMLSTTAGHFCFANQITAADMFLIPQLFASRRFNVRMDKYPTLLKIERNCLSMEYFQKAHPHFQIDTPEELRGKL